MYTKSHSRPQRGLTLIELVIFIVIVSVAVVSILQVLTLNTGASADPLVRKQAMAIAEGLMEEVQLAKFTYCDAADPNAETATAAVQRTDLTATDKCANAPETIGPVRDCNYQNRPYHNVNDYDGAICTQDVAGVNFQPGYSATITVMPDATLGPVGARIPSTTAPLSLDVLRIIVTVSFPNGAGKISLDGYRTRYAPTTI